MIGNLQNIDKNKKEKLINFSEIVKKNREKEKKEKDIQKEKFTIILAIACLVSTHHRLASSIVCVVIH